MPVDLNNVWEKLCEVKHELHGSLGMCTHSVEELKEKQAPGKAKKGKTWCPDTGTWVEEKTA